MVVILREGDEWRRTSASYATVFGGNLLVKSVSRIFAKLNEVIIIHNLPMMHPNHSHTQNRSNLFNNRRCQHSSSFYPFPHPLSLPTPTQKRKKKRKKRGKKKEKKEKTHSSISSIPTLFQNITSNIRTNFRLTSHSTQFIPFRIRNQRIIWCMLMLLLRVIIPSGKSSRDLREQECGKKDKTVDFHAEG